MHGRIQGPGSPVIHTEVTNGQAIPLDRLLLDAERANRDIALDRGNWTFFGSDGGGAAKLHRFLQACGVEPFAWFRECSRASRRTPSPG